MNRARLCKCSVHQGMFSCLASFASPCIPQINEHLDTEDLLNITLQVVLRIKFRIYVKYIQGCFRICVKNI